MKINYYLYSSGELKRQDQSLVFITKANKIYVPVNQINHLFIFSSIDMNQNVIKLLNMYDVVVFYFTFNGQFIGKYMPYKRYIGTHLIAQVTFIQDMKKKQLLAKSMLLGAYGNMLFLMKYYLKNGRKIQNELNLIGDLIEKIDSTNSIGEILLTEAQIKKTYYHAFDKIIINSEFKFEERSTYPPLNEVNAMMSFGYALLYSRIEGSIIRSRLTIELPFIHGYSKKDSGLHHDIADIFKPILVDRLVFRLINKKIMNKSDFEKQKNGIYMTKYGMKKFILYFDEYLRTTINIKGRSLSFQQILSKEVHKISRHVIDQKTYVPFTLSRW